MASQVLNQGGKRVRAILAMPAPARTPLLLLPAMFVWACLWPTASNAQGTCHHCGCQTDRKPKLCLVKTYQQIEVPQYVWMPQPTFLPDKGAICYPQHRSDLHCRLQRQCNRACHCGKHLNWGPQGTPLKCCCWLESGCQNLLGAKPTGRHQECFLRQPDEPIKIHVPVVQWKKVCQCRKCVSAH